MAADVTVQHDAVGRRFIAVVEGQEAYVAYVPDGTTLDFNHTFVPPALRGRGLAERVVRAGFEHARQQGLTVLPSCPYISGTFLRRYPQWRSVVDPSWEG
jgi:predicted GNAT family acetyltransferase